MIRIAIAEDQTLMRKLLIKNLEETNEFEVVAEAANGLELIHALQQLSELPHLCLLDLNMPEMDGIDTLIYLRKTWPEIKTLALTIYNEPYIIIKLMREGINGHIVKNVVQEDLYSAIRQVINEGFYISKETLEFIRDKSRHITEKEQIFLTHCCSELSYKEIADKMKLSQRTVEGYRDALFDKLNIHSRSGLVLFALQHGIVLLNK